MARVGKTSSKRKTTNKVRLDGKGSDQSDEDYMVGEDEEYDESDDDYCSSLADDELEESFGEFADEEEEGVRKKSKKVGRPRTGKGFQIKKKNAVVKPRKKKADYTEEEDCDTQGYDFGDEQPRKRTRVFSTEKSMYSCIEKKRKKTQVSYREEKEDCDDSDDENDEEFTPDEVDGDDDEELPVTKKNKTNRLRVQETRNANGHKMKRDAKGSKRTKKRKPGWHQRFRKKSRSDDDNVLRNVGPISRKKKSNTERGKGRRKPSQNSESNFLSSGSSDYEYTISEEEREQIREASEFCRRLTTNLRGSSYSKMTEEEEILPSERKRLARKGKEKVVDVKVELGKQVCGICLSEEGNRTVRGILNCCSHYFCLTCIMEWSKVESRCPLCKQRFSTISRTTRTDGGRDLREAVIPVPERDQVYQPSEEELRGYLDPYENVLCTECHQGGDDSLMLLCDLCDSPAHTYCVGLGREVPEGNWYCDGCRPTVLNSNAQSLTPPPGNGANNFSVGSSPLSAVRETFDLNEAYVPETPLTQVIGLSPSPRQPAGDLQPVSPASGSGAFTLFERRRIQRQIHQLLNNRSRQSDRSGGVASVSGISLFGSQIVRDGVTHNVMMAPENIPYQGTLPSYNTSSLSAREVLSPRLSNSRGQLLHRQASTFTENSFDRQSLSELSGINSRTSHGFGHQQLHPCNSISNVGPDASISSYQFREVSCPSLEKSRLQSMVRSHLKSISRNMDLGYSTFKYIARTSTHTILAASGLEHRRNEVYAVRARPLICDHDSSANQQRSLIRGQCSSCFNMFVRNVVREITHDQGFPLQGVRST